MKKIIRINENAYKKLFETVDSYNTPQQFIKNLIINYNFGNLPNSQMTNEDVISIIQNELSSNQELIMLDGENNINHFGFIDNILKQNGKIYVERSISLTNVDDILTYDGLGTSWSWEKDGSEAYFGQGDINIILKGYTKLENIDWEKTVFLNAYPLNEQKEIRIKTNSIIELDKFSFNGKKYKLKMPILINSGTKDIGIM